jgi:hypothetical protein
LLIGIFLTELTLKRVREKPEDTEKEKKQSEQIYELEKTCNGLRAELKEAEDAKKVLLFNQI